MSRTPRKVGMGIAVVAAVALIAALYYWGDPASAPLAPKCIFHAITGWDCPGCGSQRMLHALLHGEFAAAWEANAFIICASPLIMLLAFSTACRARMPRLYRRLNSLPVIFSIALSLIAWTIGRNIL